MTSVNGTSPTRYLAFLVPAVIFSTTLSTPGYAAPPAFDACIDFHCDRTQHVSLANSEWAQVTALFAGNLSPANERAKIQQAIALLERLVGSKTGTWRDLAENGAVAGQPGQLDCIAESINSTTYLRLLERAGLLRWHQADDRVRRQRWVFAIHWTAVIRDKRSGRRYAVDSWYRDNGLPPLVQPLEDWRRALAASAN